jgi:hypothetical protein
MTIENTVITSTDTPNDVTTETTKAQSTEQTLVDKFYSTSTAEADKAKPVEVEEKSSPDEDPKDKPEDQKAAEPDKDGKEKTEGELKYELKKPDGSSLSDESVKEIEAFAKDNAIPPEAAQKLLEREDTLLKNFVDAQFEIAKQQSLSWKKEVEADKNLGGENMKQTAFYAEKALNLFGGKEIRGLLQESGYGNHPEVVRFFRKVGLAMAPDTFEKGGRMPVEKKSMESILYPSTTDK